MLIDYYTYLKTTPLVNSNSEFAFTCFQPPWTLCWVLTVLKGCIAPFLHLSLSSCTSLCSLMELIIKPFSPPMFPRHSRVTYMMIKLFFNLLWVAYWMSGENCIRTICVWSLKNCQNNFLLLSCDCLISWHIHFLFSETPPIWHSRQVKTNTQNATNTADMIWPKFAPKSFYMFLPSLFIQSPPLNQWLSPTNKS